MVEFERLLPFLVRGITWIPWLDGLSLARVALTNKECCVAASSEEVWKTLCGFYGVVLSLYHRVPWAATSHKSLSARGDSLVHDGVVGQPATAVSLDQLRTDLGVRWVVQSPIKIGFGPLPCNIWPEWGECPSKLRQLQSCAWEPDCLAGVHQ